MFQPIDKALDAISQPIDDLGSKSREYLIPDVLPLPPERPAVYCAPRPVPLGKIPLGCPCLELP